MSVSTHADPMLEFSADARTDAAQRRAADGGEASIAAGNSIRGGAVAKLPGVDQCASCGRSAIVGASPGGALVVLDGPRGQYALCRGCLGRDAEPRRPAPNVLAERRRQDRTEQREPSSDRPPATPWERMRDAVALRDADRLERRRTALQHQQALDVEHVTESKGRAR